MDIENLHAIEYQIQVKNIRDYGGDLGFIEFFDHMALIVHMDGSGHDLSEFRAVDLAENFIRDNISKDMDLLEIMRELNVILKNTVGAAIFLGIINLKTLRMEYVSIGNITCVKYEGKFLDMAKSIDGIMGNLFVSPKMFTFNLKPDDLLVLFSDGIKYFRSEEDFSSNNNVKIICDKIMENDRDGEDDASCIVIKVK